MKSRIFTALMILSLTFGAGATALANGKDRTTTRSTDMEQNNQAYIAREVQHGLTMLPYYSLFDWFEYRLEDDTVILAQHYRLRSNSGG